MNLMGQENSGSRADQILRNLVKVNRLFLDVISNVQLPESLWNPDAEGYVYLGPTQTLDPPRAGLIDGVLEEVTGVALVVSLVTGYFTDPEIKAEIDKALNELEFKKVVDDFVEKRKNLYDEGTTAEIQHQSGKDLVGVASILTGVGAAIKGIKKSVTFTKELTTSVKRWGDDLADAGGGLLSQFDNTIARLTGKSKFSLTGTGKYKTVKGHHPMAKKAFEGDLAYDYKEAFSVKVSSLEDAWKTANQGIPQNIHGKITGQQNSLYSAWKKANPNKKMSLDEMADIEIQSMVNSGIPEDVATGWVVKSIEDLKLQGVTEIKNIPWNGVN